MASVEFTTINNDANNNSTTNNSTAGLAFSHSSDPIMNNNTTTSNTATPSTPPILGKTLSGLQSDNNNNNQKSELSFIRSMTHNQRYEPLMYARHHSVWEQKTFVSFGVFNPKSGFRCVWDAIVMCVVLYNLYYVPYRTAFEKYDGRIGMDNFVDAVYAFDIIIKFMTAYLNPDDKFVTNYSLIAQRYLSTWFIVDIVSVIPFDTFSPGAGNRFSKVVRILELSLLWKSTNRIVQFKGTMFEFNTLIPPSFYRLWKIAFLFCTCAHTAACIWVWIGRTDSDNPDSWFRRVFDDEGVVDSSEERQYLVALYWVCVVWATVGFGDITPVTNAELAFTLFMILCGACFFAVVTANLVSIVSGYDKRKAIYQNKMLALRQYLEDRGEYMDTRAISHVLGHMSDVWRREFGNSQETQILIRQIPMNLRYYMATSILQDLIKQSDILSSVCDNHRLISILSEKMTMHKHDGGEVIAIKNYPMDRVYFVRTGMVDALHSNHKPVQLVESYPPGSSFGDIGLIRPQWYAHMRVAEASTLWSINLEEFRQILIEQNVLQQVMKIVDRHLHQIEQRYNDIRSRERPAAQSVSNHVNSQSTSQSEPASDNEDQGRAHNNNNNHHHHHQQQQQQHAHSHVHGRTNHRHSNDQIGTPNHHSSMADVVHNLFDRITSPPRNKHHSSSTTTNDTQHYHTTPSSANAQQSDTNMMRERKDSVEEREFEAHLAQQRSAYLSNK